MSLPGLRWHVLMKRNSETRTGDFTLNNYNTRVATHTTDADGAGGREHTIVAAKSPNTCETPNVEIPRRMDDMSLLPSSRAYPVSEAPKYHRRGQSPSSCARLMRVFITHFVIVCTGCENPACFASIAILLLLNRLHTRVLATQPEMLAANTSTTLRPSPCAPTNRLSTKPMPR